MCPELAGRCDLVLQVDVSCACRQVCPVLAGEELVLELVPTNCRVYMVVDSRLLNYRSSGDKTA